MNAFFYLGNDKSKFGIFYVNECSVMFIIDFFFFQAEDGIRDDLVTGVQTCALPIYDKRCAGHT